MNKSSTDQLPMKQWHTLLLTRHTDNNLRKLNHVM